MANVLLPFLVLPLFAAMIRIDDRLLQAAASLGAPPRTIFWKVYFPLTLPALAAGALLVFILCLGFYVTPAILGGGRVPMISNLLDTLINRIPRWEQASAISTILLIVTLLIFAAYRRLDRKASHEHLSSRAQRGPDRLRHEQSHSPRFAGSAGRGGYDQLALDAPLAGGGRYLRPGVPRRADPDRDPDVVLLGQGAHLPAARLLAALVRGVLRRSALDGRDVDLDRRGGGLVAARAGAGQPRRLRPAARQLRRPRLGRGQLHGAVDRADDHRRPSRSISASPRSACSARCSASSSRTPSSTCRWS